MKLSDFPPGAIIPTGDAVEINAGLPTTVVLITNEGDVPVHVTAHMHVFEANPMLCFDRRRAFGMRPNVPVGLAIRLEPGETKPMQLVPIGGNRVVRGFAGLVDGPLDEIDVDDALAKAIERGYRHRPED